MTCRELFKPGYFFGQWYEVETIKGIVQIKFDIDVIPTIPDNDTVECLDVTNIIENDRRAPLVEDMIDDAIIHNLDYFYYKNKHGIHKVYIDILETKE